MRIMFDDKIYMDLHIHSKYSYDSLLSPSKIIKIAKKVGLSGVAITDHNTIRGSIEAKKFEDKSIFIIVGSEIKTDHGDVIGLFLTDDIISRNFDHVIDEIREQGGIVVLPHPYKNGGHFVEQLASNVDMLEVNGRLPTDKNILSAILARSLNKPIIGNSDAHTSMEIGCIKTLFENGFVSEEELRKNLLNSNRIIVGEESPRWVHYVSCTIGTLKTRNTKGLFRAICDEVNRIK